MTKAVERDARRWSAFERLAADASASPSERTQAREQIEALRQRYPGGRPRTVAEEADDEPGWGWRDRRHHREPEPSPAEREAAAAAARARRAEAVAAQRALVERVPGWEKSAALQDMRSCSAAWSPEEQALFKAERIRLTGSSRAVDL